MVVRQVRSIVGSKFLRTYLFRTGRSAAMMDIANGYKAAPACSWCNRWLRQWQSAVSSQDVTGSRRHAIIRAARSTKGYGEIY